MYNPVTRSYGEPHKRPEVQNSTVEFIASSDYMVSLPVSPLEGSLVSAGFSRCLMYLPRPSGHLAASSSACRLPVCPRRVSQRRGSRLPEVLLRVPSAEPGQVSNVFLGAHCSCCLLVIHFLILIHHQ